MEHTARRNREKPTDPARTLFGGRDAHAGQVSAICRAGVVKNRCGSQSGLLPFGLLFCQFGPYPLPVVGAKHLPGYCTFSEFFDVRAVLKWHASHLPVAYCCRGHFELSSQLHTPAQQVRCMVDGVR